MNAKKQNWVKRRHSLYLHRIMKERLFPVSDGLQIVAYEFLVDKPKIIIHISHGMAEHGMRYERFALACNEFGFSVIVNDHRGHGKTSRINGKRGFFTATNGWDRATDDLVETHKIIRSEHPGVKTILLGHSMGAILAASAALKLERQLDGLVLSALAHHPGALLPIGKGLSKTLSALFGAEKESPLMDKLTFGDFNKSFKPNRTDFDWLSRDESEVDKYIADKDCGERFTNRFFYDLLSGLSLVHQEAHALPIDMPYLFMAGGADPVVGFEKNFLKTAEHFAKGKKNFTRIIYENARHEVLNEVNRQEVYEDIINWTLELLGSEKSAFDNEKSI